MRLVKNVMFFVFLIVIFASLWINIIIVTSQKTTKLDILDTLNGIYFDDSELSSENISEINELINSNNSITFTKLIRSNNPIKAFYGFCGFMKGNQKQAMKYLDELIISTKKVDIYVNNKQVKSILGYAILMLITDFPDNLTNKPIDDFYAMSEKSVEKAYKSQVIKLNAEYNKQLVKLITKKYPSIASKLSKTTTTTTVSVVETDLSSKTLEEKVTISAGLASYKTDIKEKLILQLLNENDSRILANVLNSINAQDTSSVADALFKKLPSQTNSDTIVLIIKKYAVIMKNNSLPNIQEFMKSNLSSEKILFACLQEIYNYGDENYYEFLKLFLDTRYSEDLNLLGLRTIIQTTYKSNPANVMKTILFIIRYLESEKLAYYSINFCMTNSIPEGAVSVILPRLQKKESVEMKKLAIDYIDKFSLKDGIPLIQELTLDEDVDIQEKAKALVLKLTSM